MNLTWCPALFICLSIFESFLCKSVTAVIYLKRVLFPVRGCVSASLWNTVAADCILSALALDYPPRWSRIMGWNGQSNEGSGNVLIYPKTHLQLSAQGQEVNELLPKKKIIHFELMMTKKNVTCQPKIELWHTHTQFPRTFIILIRVSSNLIYGSFKCVLTEVNTK